MGKEIGVGVRVWIGWGISPNLRKMIEDPRLKQATVINGPWLPGEIYRSNVGGPAKRTTDNTWEVRLDSGYEIRCAEHVLFPVDDGDDAEMEEHDEIAEAV